MQIPKPQHTVFMCQVNRPPEFPKPGCVREDRGNLFAELQQKIMQSGKMMEINLVPTGCLNRCNFGPVMRVEPGEYMYVDLTSEKLNEIFEKHLIGGEPVKEYLIPEEFWV